MEKSYFSQKVILERKIWDIPKIMDFCVLYGPRSKEKMQEVVERLFSAQPKLREDLVAAVPGMEKALEKAVHRITSNVCSIASQLQRL